MIKIKKCLSLTMFFFSVFYTIAQNEINVNVTDAICNGESGSIYLSLTYPASPQFPLPYTVEVENRWLGTETYLDMDSSILKIENLNPSNYLITIYFNETCKLDLPITILGNNDIVEKQVLQPCGMSAGKIAFQLNETNLKPSWTYPFTGTLTNTVSNQVMPFTMTTSEMEFDNLNAGNYELSLRLDPSCTLIEKIELPHQPFAEIQLNESFGYFPACKGQANGQLSINAKDSLGFSNINSNCTFLWSNNATKRTISGLTAGQYCVTVTSVASPQCKISKCFDVEEFDVTLTAETIDPNSCTTPNGYIKVKPSNNKFPYNYTWSNGATGQELVGLSGGQYCVTVSFAQCNEVLCYDLKPLCCNNNLSISATVTKGYEGGPNPASGIIDVSVSGGSGYYTYKWSIYNNAKNDYDVLTALNGHIQSQLESGNYLVEVRDTLTGCNTYILKSLTNFKCSNNLGDFFVKKADFMVPLAFPTWDENQDCSLNKGRRLYVGWANGSNSINVKLPLKVELIPPAGVPHISGTVIMINTPAELAGMKGPTPTYFFQPLYRVQDPYYVVLTDGCGFTRSFEITTCLECQSPIYEDYNQSKNKVFLQYSNGTPKSDDLALEVKNPCKKGGNYIKLIGKPYSGFKYTIIWPNGDSCAIENSYKNKKIIKTNEKKFKFNVSKEQFDAKLPLIVTVKRGDADCIETVSIVFNGGKNDLVFIPTNAPGYGNLEGTYRGFGTCNQCSSLPASPSEYTTKACPNKFTERVFWDYIPNDPENVCSNGGRFVTDIIDNGQIISSVAIVPAGIPILEELDEYVEQPEEPLLGKCTKGTTCVFDSRAIFGPNTNEKIMLRYCNIYSKIDPFDQPPSSCSGCPSSVSATTEGQNLKLLIKCSGFGTGRLTVTSPNGQIQTIEDIKYWPPSTEFLFNTGGLLGKFDFELDPQCPSGCSTLNASGDNGKKGCPLSFDVTNFVYSNPKTAHILINSSAPQNGQLYIRELGSSVNIEAIAIELKTGENFIKFPCSNLEIGHNYEAVINFINSFCDELKNTFTYVSQPSDCPEIEIFPILDRIQVTTTSSQTYAGKFFLLVFDVLKNVVIKVPLKIDNGQNINKDIDMSKLPKGDYTIKIVNTIGCPLTECSWTKTFIVDPNPDGDCIMNRSVDLYYDSKIDEYIHTTSESFEASSQYTLTSISDSTFTTISEFVRLSYDSLIVTHIRIDDYGNYIVIGIKSGGTSVLLITPSKLVVWYKYFPDFIVTSVPYYTLASKYPLDIIGKLTYIDVFYSLKIDYQGSVISYLPLQYYDSRTGENRVVDNAYWHKESFTSSYYKNGTTRVSIYNPSTNFTRSITLDSFIKVKQILRLESGEYLIAGDVSGQAYVGDSLIYEYYYPSGIFIWTDTVLNIIETKIFDINEAISIKNVVTNGFDKYLVVYTTNDTIFYQSNDSTQFSSCDQIYGFDNTFLQNRDKKESIAPITSIVNSNKSSLEIYPNPSNGSFNIRLLSDENTTGYFSILSINGKNIQKENIEVQKGENTFSISNPLLISGLYIFESKLSNGEEFHVKLMVVK